MEANNSSIKSYILSTFKSESQETLNQNNYVLFLKISTDLDKKFIQLLTHLTTIVKEMISEMSRLCMSSYPPPTAPSTHLSPHIHTHTLQIIPQLNTRVGITGLKSSSLHNSFFHNSWHNLHLA